MLKTKMTIMVLALAGIALSGCFGDDDDGTFDPNRSYELTGRTIHLKMSVVDLFDTEIAPDLLANMWAFCVQPFDENDAISAAAIEYRTPLAGDAPLLTEAEREKCGVPGPTIRVQQGDHVIVEFEHSHFHPHTIHWHGQFVPWEHDGAPGVTQDSVVAGESFTYDFIASRAGTLWYHCHVDTQLHVMQGLYGAFIVEPQETKYEPKNIDKEYTWVLSTATSDVVRAIPGVNPHSQHPAGNCASGFPGCENPPADVTPDVWMINGHSYPLTMHSPETMINVSEGERIRIRLINVGETSETMHPHGHDMLVTHRDGNPLESPFWVDTLLIGPAERYDVVMLMDNPGPWMFHTHINSHETNCGKSGGGMHSMILYEGYEGHKFAAGAELPANCAFEDPFALEPDYFDTQRLNLGTADDVNAAVSFPIVQACSIRTATVRAELIAGTSLLATLNELTVDVKDPSGAILATGTLGGNGGPTKFNWTTTAGALVSQYKLDFEDRLLGNWTVEVNGRAVEATVFIEAQVDYLEDISQSRIHHAFEGVPVCPGVTT